MPRRSEYQVFNPKKRIENTYTQSGRIAKLRLSKCSANSFEHCRTRAVYLNSPERPERPFAEQSPFYYICLGRSYGVEWGSPKKHHPAQTTGW